MESIYKKLFDKELIETKQFELLDAINTNKIISGYNELRIMLYLGIMLLTSGIGYFAYQNMGKLGHISAMVLLFVAIIACFYFIMTYAVPYSNAEVKIVHPYYDYILILASLLVIGLFGYIQVYFNLVQLLLKWSTLISALLLLFMAYRFDNRALLSMGITALSATFGIVISPVNWVEGAWLPSVNLYNIGILLGAGFVLMGFISQVKHIKSHFRFTYQNAGLLIFFIACLAAMIQSEDRMLYTFILLLSSAAVFYYSWVNKEFLFFLYASITGYISLTYLLFRFLSLFDEEGLVFMIYYVPASCIGFIVFLIKNKKHFKND